MAHGAGDNKVGGTGTIEPNGGIVRLAGVPGYDIKEIYVKEGQTVTRGTALFAQDDITAELGRTNADLDLTTVKRDAEFHTDIEAMTLRLVEMRLQHAKKDAANYRAVGPGGTSEKELSRLQQVVEENQASLDIEKVRAEQLQYDLVNQVRAAALRRDSAAATADRFTARAPGDGTVLKIYKLPGDRASGDTILYFGDLSTMYVNAQVYQGDVFKVKIGMKATVKNSAFPNLATGRVERISHLIGSRSQLGDVLIRLDKTDLAARLVGMEVEVVIGP
ncbi:MAG: efflux RND transporter periplasmic adaptor subunit [Stellaceae bacterium]